MPVRPHHHATPRRCDTCQEWPEFAIYVAAALNALDTKLDSQKRHFDRRVDKLKELIMATQDDINAVAAQETKAFGEIRGLLDTLQQSITDLEAQVAAGNTLDLTGVQAAAQALDDIVPDAPAEPPADPNA